MRFFEKKPEFTTEFTTENGYMSEFVGMTHSEFTTENGYRADMSEFVGMTHSNMMRANTQSCGGRQENFCKS